MHTNIKTALKSNRLDCTTKMILHLSALVYGGFSHYNTSSKMCYWKSIICTQCSWLSFSAVKPNQVWSRRYSKLLNDPLTLALLQITGIWVTGSFLGNRMCGGWINGLVKSVPSSPNMFHRPDIYACSFMSSTYPWSIASGATRWERERGQKLQRCEVWFPNLEPYRDGFPHWAWVYTWKS